MNLMLNALVIFATVLGSGMALPQARRLATTRRADGVSPTWVGVSLALNAWWIAYALAAPVWALLPVSVISFGLYAFMAFLFVTSIGRSSLRGLTLGILGLGMVPLPFLIVGGWELAGVVVGLCYGLQLLPAVVAVLRTRELGGVSAATWLIAWVESFIWFVYGYGRSDVALIAAGLLGVAMASVILARLALTGHRPMAPFGRRAMPARWRKAQPSLS
jgi:uncharacterized protein with PQ loop repeat